MREALFAAIVFLTCNWTCCLLISILAWTVYLGLWASRDKRNPSECKMFPVKRDWGLLLWKWLVIATTALLVISLVVKFYVLPVAGGMSAMLSPLRPF